MDYEQFYRYLDSRPQAEIRECVRGVFNIAKKHSIDVNFTNTPTDHSEPVTTSQYHGLQISQQVWFQQAIWNKFGSSSTEHTTLKDLRLANSNLFMEEKVIEFQVKVNKMINEEVEPATSRTCVKEKQLKLENWSKPSSAQKKKPALPHTPRPPPSRHSTVSASEQHPSASSDSEWMHSSDSEMESASDRSNSAAVQKRRRKASMARMVWTPEMDAALKVAAAKHRNDGWDAVARHVGFAVTGDQCGKRWSARLKPSQQSMRRDGDCWDETEVSRLKTLVLTHTIAPYWSERYKVMTKQRIDWQTLGKELGRLPAKCKEKWDIIRKRKHS